MQTCCLYTCYRPKKKALFCHAFTLFVPIKHAAIGDSEPSWLSAIALALRWPSANLNSNLSIQLIWNSPPNHDKNGSNSDDIKDLCVWGENPFWSSVYHMARSEVALPISVVSLCCQAL